MTRSNDIDFERWAKEYEKEYEKDQKGYVEYTDQNGYNSKDRSPYFTAISEVLQERGYLLEREFISICEWKTKRQEENYQYNKQEDIKKVTKTVMSIHPDSKKQIAMLSRPTEKGGLKGVGVPTASAILTVIYPKEYCVIDYRTWRTLYWIKHKPLNFENYSDFLETLDFLGTYTSQRSYYNFLGQVRKLAASYDMTPRGIEMALWMYDAKGGKIE